MKRINNKKNLYKSIILLVILVIGIGYAYLTSNLSISGQTEVVANTWNIHFENLNVKEGSVTASTPATIDSNNTSISYAITLSRPKEYYEFTVDVKNDGTLPGKVSISTLSGLDTTSSKIIDYSITYTNGNPVNVGDILNAGAKKTIRVRVFYKDDISESDFPSTDLNLNLTYTLQYVQSEEDSINLNNTIINLSQTNNCVTKYNGEVTDTVGGTTNATKVYFDNCSNKRNVIFGGFCWQVIRTTETGGTKLLFNGKPINNSCETSNNMILVYTNTTVMSYNLEGNYVYGSLFKVNLDNTFSLIDTTVSTWSDSTYEDLIGKYTCRMLSDKCDRIYFISSYRNNSEAYVTSYSPSSSSTSRIIGTSSFNPYNKSLAMSGYMFNKVYSTGYINTTNGEYKFGSSFSYNSNTNTYTLTGDVQTVNNLSRNYEQAVNTKYTCWDLTGECTTLSYYLYQDGLYGYYLDLVNGKDIDDMINDMLYSNDVNRYNSGAKAFIDSWYKYNMLDYNSYLEDVVYCNNRAISDYGYFGKNEKTLDNNDYLKFDNDDYNMSLKCSNITDQFSLSNNKAKLEYPVSLITGSEFANISSNDLRNISYSYWSLSPNSYVTDSLNITGIAYGGALHKNYSGNTFGIRPAISLAGFNTISYGDGSLTNPWIVE